MLFRKLNVRGARVEIKSLEELEGIGKLLWLDDGSEFSIAELTRAMFPSTNSSKSKANYLQNTGILKRLEQQDVLLFTRESGKKKYYRLDVEKVRILLKNWAIEKGMTKTFEEMVREW